MNRCNIRIGMLVSVASISTGTKEYDTGIVIRYHDTEWACVLLGEKIQTIWIGHITHVYEQYKNYGP